MDRDQVPGTAGRHARERKAPTAPDPTPVRTLVVDDIEGHRRLYEIILGSDGRFDIVGQASDGEGAIDLARVLQPDLVLLDRSMPGMDGLEALPKVRTAAPDAAVVIVSGVVEDRLAPAARKRGAAAFLEKGLSPEDLLQCLCDVMGIDAAAGGAAGRVRDARDAADRPAGLGPPWDA